jgi:starch-binding outer membrane protein, SusD/RagB family
MKLSKIYFVVILFLLSTACDEAKHLQLSPPDQITEANFYNTQTEIEQAVNAVYRELGGTIASAGSVADLYGELYSDNTTFIFQTAGDPVDEAISGYIQRPENSRIESAWNNTYSSIFVTNSVINVIENTNVEINEQLKSRWIGEAITVRSLAYFNLVRAFGAVPLIVERISPVEAYDYLREDPDVIYNQLIADLTFAKSVLPANYSGEDVGRITRYAAAAILAKIYLTQGDHSAAQSELELIIQSGQFSLDANGDGVVDVNDFEYLFLPDTKNSNSSILEAQYMAGVNAFNSNHQQRYMPFHHAFTLPGVPGANFRGDGVNTPSTDIIEAFEEGDPRLNISIKMGYDSPATGEFVEHPFTFKFFDPNYSNAGQNFSIIRYADILLMYAEVTGDPQYLNMVRDRVGLPHFGSDEYPSDLYPTLELAIEHERRVELTHEMHRMFDLVRTGRAIEVLQSKGFDFTQDKILFPIPQDAIDVNPALSQNPGY